MRTWAATTAERIRTSTITEPQLRSMRKILKGAINRRTQQVKCTDVEAYDLIDLIAHVQPRVSDDQAQAATDWLRNKVWTPKGALRNTKHARYFHDGDRRVLQEDGLCYQLVSLEVIQSGGYRWVDALIPAYRCVGKSGSFTYCSLPWQSGGHFWIAEHA